MKTPYVNDSRRAGLSLAQAFYNGAGLRPVPTILPLRAGEICLGETNARYEPLTGQTAGRPAKTTPCRLTNQRFALQPDGSPTDLWFADVSRAECDGHAITLTLSQGDVVRLAVPLADYWFVLFTKAAYQRVAWPPLPDDEPPAAPEAERRPSLPGASPVPVYRPLRRSTWRVFGRFASESFFGQKTTIFAGLLGLVGGIALMVDNFSAGQVRDGLICLLLAALSTMSLVITRFGTVRDRLPALHKALAALGLAGPLLVVAFVALHLAVLLAAIALPLLLLRILLFSSGGGSGSSDPFRYVEALDNPARYRQRQDRGY